VLAGGWLGVGGLGVGWLGVGGLGVSVKKVCSCNLDLSQAMAVHVAKSVGRSMRFSAFLSVRPNLSLGAQLAVGAPPNR